MISTGFTSLDAAIGGLTEKKDYLLYGPLGSGKTAFALNYLYAGLRAGEVVALITRRSPRMVFDHGRTFGWDLELLASKSQLILLEYTPKILHNTAGLGDESQIMAELDRLLRGNNVRRIVFDPFTPMLEGTVTTNVAFRCRALLEQLAGLKSTNLYVMDTPESDPYLHHCRDQFHGLIRTERTSLATQTYRLTVERTPTLQNQLVQVDFQLRCANGMAELSMAEFVTTTTNEHRKVLTIVPSDRQPLFRNALRDGYTIVEASSAADGMAKIAAVSPDLVIIDREGLDINGLEICRKLRANGLNMPIIVIGEHLRRARDRVEIAAVGADACLQRPIDGRLLKLEIQNLLHRYDANANRLQGRVPDAKVLADLNRKGRTRTTDTEYFFQRVEQEITYSNENDLSFSVILLQLDLITASGLNDCANVAQSLIRECDLVLASDRSVAVLLAETGEAGASAFLKGFHHLYKAELPRVTCRFYEQQPDFVEGVKQVVEDGLGSEETWRTHARS